MRKYLLVLAFLAGIQAVLPASSAPVPASSAGAVMKTAINGFFVPGYERLGGEAELMADRMDALCADPSAAVLSAARDAFGALVHAWARVSLIRFGPVIADNRLERLSFWPDRRSIALKQVQAALAERDATVLSAETLAQKSVGLQGLGPLEFILFGTGSDDMAAADDGFRCRFGGAIAGNIAGIAHELFAAWDDPDGIAGRLIAPDPANPDYRSTDEVLSEFLGLFAHGVEAVRATEIAPMLGKGPESAKPKAALFWRAGLTVDTLAWQVEGLHDLFIVSGLSDLLGPDSRWLGGAVAFEFQNFATASAAIDGPLDGVLADAGGWGRVNYLQILTKSIERQFGANIAGALGLDLGFSALDGD